VTPYDDNDDVEAQGVPDFLRDPVGILRRRWAWILLGLSLGIAGTALLLWTAEPTYEATATILVASQQIPEEFVRTTVLDDPFTRINAMVGSVLSRRKLVELIEEFDLYPELSGQITLDEVAGIMRSNVTIEPAKQLGGRVRHETALVFAISYRGRDREVTADIANRLAALFLEAGLKSRMEHAIGISNFLRAELERTDTEMREHGKLLTEFKEAHRGELPGDQDANLRRMERYQDHRANLARQIAEAEARVAVLTSEANAEPNEGALEVQLRNLRQHYELEQAVHTPEHPNILALERQIAILQEQVDELDAEATQPSQNAGVDAAKKTVLVLKTQLSETEATLAELDIKVQRTPKVAEELGTLREKASVLREKYPRVRSVRRARVRPGSGPTSHLTHSLTAEAGSGRPRGLPGSRLLAGGGNGVPGPGDGRRIPG